MNELWLPVLIGLVGGGLTLIPAIFGRIERQKKIEGPIRGKIARPPGTVMRRIAHFLLPTEDYKNIIEPLIAEMQFEYFDALQRGVSGRWIRFQWSLGFWSVIASRAKMPITLAAVTGGMAFGLMIADIQGAIVGIFVGLVIGTIRQYQIGASRTRREHD